ncbi:MAG: hypothetical protein R3B90_05525 [Planctomycetaceae bacterium]
MFLQPSQPSPYDIHFGVLGIPVRVTPFFWLITALLGWSALDEGPVYLFIWMLVVFVSILVHEIGHATAARAFGYPPQILLHQFGGLAMYAPYRDYTLTRSILITAAGPLAGLILGGLSIAASFFTVALAPDPPPQVQAILSDLIFVNIAWSLVNLLPVIPMDGGQICRDVLLIFWPRQGLRIALGISLAVAAGVTILAIMFKQIYIAMMFGFMAFGSLNELQGRR